EALMTLHWVPDSPKANIEEYITMWGVDTEHIHNTERLLDLVSQIYEVRNDGIPASVEAKIYALGPDEWWRLAKQNLKAVMGEGGWLEHGRAGATTLPEPQIVAALDRASAMERLPRTKLAKLLLLMFTANGSEELLAVVEEIRRTVHGAGCTT